jgi:histone deacetylase 1/2
VSVTITTRSQAEYRLEIPNNEYYEYYGPHYELDVRPSNMTDRNAPSYLDKIRESVFETLRDKNAAPSVQLHCESQQRNRV